MKVKQFDTAVKAAGPDDGLKEGQFRALVSVFGNEDSVGDVVMPGAFSDDLAAWKDSGDPLPIIWAHDWRSPESHIGHALDAKETSLGLEVLAQLDEVDLEDPHSRTSKVYRLLKGRRVKQMSFAYDVLEGGWAERDGHEVYELRRLKVHEAGPCLLGANQETELLAVKAHDIAARLKAGDTIDLDQLTGAYDALGAVIEATKTPAPSGAGTTKREAGQPDPDPANVPAAPGASAEQPSKVSPAQVAAWTTLKEIA